MQDTSDLEIYLKAFYFVVTTLVTVGYGDISATNTAEELMCILLMLMGVMCFSFATGTIASLITTYDSQEALMKEKIATLNDIHIEYGIQTELFNRLARNIKFDHSKKKKDIAHFIEELPNQLRIELAMVIHQKMYSNVQFFKGKDKSLIAWIGSVIKPLTFDAK